MTESKRRWAAVAIAVVVLSSITPLPAVSGDPPASEADAVNVKLTVRLGKLVDGKRADQKSYDLVLISGGMGSRLLSGDRVPFSGSGEADDGPPIYQNIGFTTEAHAWVLDDGRIKVVATIEDSRIEEGEGGAPTVETRQLSVGAVLKPGVPLEVTRVDGIRDQSGFVEIEADILP